MVMYRNMVFLEHINILRAFTKSRTSYLNHPYRRDKIRKVLFKALFFTIPSEFNLLFSTIPSEFNLLKILILTALLH